MVELLRQQQKMLGDDRALSMAEIGVWYGNVSVHLLSEFPTLHMLLVDPYHLRSEGLVEPRSCLHLSVRKS